MEAHTVGGEGLRKAPSRRARISLLPDLIGLMFSSSRPLQSPNTVDQYLTRELLGRDTQTTSRAWPSPPSGQVFSVSTCRSRADQARGRQVQRNRGLAVRAQGGTLPLTRDVFLVKTLNPGASVFSPAKGAARQMRR